MVVVGFGGVVGRLRAIASCNCEKVWWVLLMSEHDLVSLTALLSLNVHLKTFGRCCSEEICLQLFQEVDFTWDRLSCLLTSHTEFVLQGNRENLIQAKLR